ncbi:substrate-binding domain-containing protein [Leptolyngbya boryana CZ1]|uniref:Substrate-binding domain-containing protein n=1 Tax=Leptolyngbya boryana CZ1 TaxID=3060204 RepID=A0AA96WPP2_LEPBY|nr:MULTISPECIES: substrate-binding domain-containing protein [Leptolyngbya]WNZ43861.1 substrate-binding domain-containing protein [Leptolyngbya boryana CZ1]
MMKRTLVILALGASLIGLPSCSTSPNTASTATASNTQTPIKAGSSSSTVNLLKTLKAAYENTNSDGQVTLLEPGQSENIIAGIKQGLVDIGIISKVLKPEETDGNLEYREVAKDALLVATHPSVTGIKNLTTQDLQGIYSGSITNWKELGGIDAQIIVLDRPEDESAKQLLRQHYLGKELKNAPNAIIMRKEGELIQTLQSTPYSIGAFSLAYAISNNLLVNRLSLNNIEPTPETLKTGKYPMFRRINVLWNKKASESTQAFVNYVFSPPGATVLEKAGFAATAPQTAMSQK